ncbi:MAG TPA: hypothetical protein VF116_23190 [Ktedonobacterales bacterium]
MARAPYAAGLADALDQTIADLEREAGGDVAVPAARGSASPQQRSTGVPAPSAAPPAPTPGTAPAPVPAAPPRQAEGAAGTPPAGTYGSAAGAVSPSLPDIPYPSAAPPPAQAPYAPAAAPPTDVIAGNLSTQIRRLEELRRWVRDDPAFGQLVDNMIGRQVQAAEKRQRVYTAVFSIASLAVGWLLPVLVPATNLMGLLGK